MGVKGSCFKNYLGVAGLGVGVDRYILMVAIRVR